MYKDKYQTKLFSVFNSSGSGPLDGWITERGYGSVQANKDDELRTHVLDLRSPNVATTYISSPPPPHTSLGLGLRCITMLIKYFDQPFSFEVQVVDDEDMKHRLRFSTYNRELRVTTFVTSMGLPLVPGWNVVQLDLAQFTKGAYGTMYLETVKVTIHANCRLRRIFFSDKLYSDADLPADYRLQVAPAAKQERKQETKLEEKQETKLGEEQETKLGEKQETKLEEKHETKQERKQETKLEEKHETKQERKQETKLEEKHETKQERKPETKLEEKHETKQEGKPETKLEEKHETKQEGKPETKLEERHETIQEGKPETKLEEKHETKQEGNPETKLEEKHETKQEGKPETKLGSEREEE